MKKRGLQEPEIEPVGLKTYLLIRIGMDVERGKWFGRELGQESGRKPVEKGDSAGAEGTIQGKAGIMPGKYADYADRDSEDGPGRAKHSGRAEHPAEKGMIQKAQETYEAAGREKAAPEERKGFRHCLWTLCHPVQARRKALLEKEEETAIRESRRKEARAEEEALARQERMREEIEASMRKIEAEVRVLAGEEAACFCVYEDSLRRVLITGESSDRRAVPPRSLSDGEEREGLWERSRVQAEGFLSEASGTAKSVDAGPVPGEMMQRKRENRTDGVAGLFPVLWEKNFSVQELTGYSQGFWVEQLCARAVQPHFIILGTAPCLFSVIEAHAHRMKSLRWVLLEEAYDQAVSDFAEEFYTEYGLAITVQLISDSRALKRLDFACKEPVNILDFTGEAYLAVPALPEGSVWLDVFCVEEKKRRILSRGRGISYVSLKEIWKTAQKRCNCLVLP